MKRMLAERQAESVDTAEAEEAYMHSVEATLEGDSALAESRCALVDLSI